MHTRRLHLVAIAVVVAAVAAAGCGGSSSSGPKPTAQPASGAEAKATSQGDIPDNQSFLTFTDKGAGYSIRYPEGWAQRGSGGSVTFQDKSNQVQIAVTPGRAPTVAAVQAQLGRLRTSDPTVQASPPHQLALKAGPVVKVSYSRQSPPDPVTGKKLTLLVDRYELARGGKVATVELSTPKGVDNVDAYRMMIESFRWL